MVMLFLLIRKMYQKAHEMPTAYFRAVTWYRNNPQGPRISSQEEPEILAAPEMDLCKARVRIQEDAL